MRYGYVRTSHKRVLEDFKRRAEADEIRCDISHNDVLENLLQTLTEGDTLVILSIDNLCRGFVENKSDPKRCWVYAGDDDLRLLVNTCNEKGVKLECLDSFNDFDIATFQTEQVSSTMKLQSRLKEVKEQTKGRTKYKQAGGFKPDWIQVYNEYFEGKINIRDAAKKLGIATGSFSGYAKIWES